VLDPLFLFLIYSPYALVLSLLVHLPYITDLTIGFFSNTDSNRIKYYMLFSYQTGYIMWHSRLMIYIPFGAEGNIYHKPGMSNDVKICIVSYFMYLMKENNVLNF
jgi:hypothetical protein